MNGFGFFEVFSATSTAFYAVIPSYGLAIILLTLSVRVLLLPLSIKQTRSMREMQMIQPEIKRLQKKHKGDRQKLNQEMMALYKEHGVNPFGGCAPLLLQFPVLIALFYVVRTPLAYMGFAAPENAGRGFIAPADFIARNVSGFIETLQGSRLADDLVHHAASVYNFLGLHLNCSAAGVLSGPGSSEGVSDTTRDLISSTCGSGSFVAALPYLLLVALMGFTTFYQQKQMQASRGTGDPQQQQMQMFMKIMPVFLVVLGYGFPAGVVIYWLTTNVWTIIQQRIVLKAAPPITASGAAKKTSAKTTGDKAGDKAKGDGAGKAPAKGRRDKPVKKSSDGKADGQSTAPKKKATSSSSPSQHSSKKKKKR